MLVMVVVTTATTLPRDEMSSEVQPFHADLNVVPTGYVKANEDVPKSLLRAKRGIGRKLKKGLKKLGRHVERLAKPFVQKAIVEKVVLPAIGAVAG